MAKKILIGMVVFLYLVWLFICAFPEESKALIFWIEGYQPSPRSLAGSELEVEAELQCVSPTSELPCLHWRLWEDGWNGAHLVTYISQSEMRIRAQRGLYIDEEANQDRYQSLVREHCGEHFIVSAMVGDVSLLEESGEPPVTFLYITADLLAIK